MGLFKKRCKTYRCSNLHTNASGYCDECQAKRSALYMHEPVKQGEDISPRPSAPERGYDHSWHKFAKDFLKGNPTCALCGKPAQCVDHKSIPAEIMMDLYGKFDLDPALYQPLCYSCNRRKQLEDREKIAAYFADKARLSSATPGEGSKTSPLHITPARSGSRDIYENFSEVNRG
jgi:5-methylcytosine-specific restriction endonuclease McrA